MLAVAVAGAQIGALAGWLIAVFAPSYYRLVFGLSANESGTATGVVLGGLQGGALGIGLALVLLWFQRPRAASAAGASTGSSRHPFLTAGVLLSLFLNVVLGTVALYYYAFTVMDQVPVEGVWRDDKVRLFTKSPSPRVVLALVTTRGYANLQPPIAYRGYPNNLLIDPAKLKWVDAEGKSIPPPRPRDRVQVIAPRQ